MVIEIMPLRESTMWSGCDFENLSMLAAHANSMKWMALSGLDWTVEQAQLSFPHHGDSFKHGQDVSTRPKLYPNGYQPTQQKRETISSPTVTFWASVRTILPRRR